jgi:FtsP/CotA-like multicopper oxidase with cupredoxin domain
MTPNDNLFSRRSVMTRGAVAAMAGGAVLLHDARRVSAQEAHDHHAHQPAPTTIPARQTEPPEGEYTPVTVPDGAKLPWKLVDGVKVFHLVAEPCTREFAPGLVVQTWGYNGLTHGPLIEAVEGDRCRFYVTNRLPEPTTIHWHGVLLPNGMDGVGGLTQPVIQPGETFRYEFTFKQTGTMLYHPHFDEMTQIALGMMGMIVVHPRAARDAPDRARPRADRDFALMLGEWRIDPGAARPNPSEMSDFNVLTINARSFPATSPLVVRLGQRVRIRFGNLGPMDHHPIHLHGYHFNVIGTDAGPIPESARVPQTTVLVPVGATRDIEFVADAPGDWALHCHMTHHLMNQMGHDSPVTVGADLRDIDEKVRALLPGYMTMGTSGMGDMAQHGDHMPVPANSIPMRGGRGPYGTIDMGGMVTVLKVRENVEKFDEDPGWYDHPPGTVAWRVESGEVNGVVGAGAAASPSPAIAPVAYTCPMHPEVVSDRPGKCPKCGMRLVQRR